MDWPSPSVRLPSSGRMNSRQSAPDVWTPRGSKSDIRFRPIANARTTATDGSMKRWLVPFLLLFPTASTIGHAAPAREFSSLDAAVHNVMANTGARGLALAIIDGGRVRYVQAYGV